jgi:hypothetical protein
VSDTSDYLSCIRDYAEGKDPLELQKQPPELLVELLVNASPEAITTRPSKDKWSIGEILAHLREDELATAWRYRQIVEHSGFHLMGFDAASVGANGRLRSLRNQTAKVTAFRWYHGQSGNGQRNDHPGRKDADALNPVVQWISDTKPKAFIPRE